MSNRFRRTAAGVGLALSLALTLVLVATPAAHAAAPGHAAAKTSGRAAHTASRPAGHGLLTTFWSYIVGNNPFGPKPTQGPTVDPNGIS
jgi:hypothetical protein